MKKMKLVGIDDWDRPVYKDELGALWKDVNLGKNTPYLHKAVNNDFEGEPDYPIKAKFEIVDVLPLVGSCDTCDNHDWQTDIKVDTCSRCKNNTFYRPKK